MANEEPTHKIISRKEALARGLKRYFPNQKCNKGHLSERTVSSWQCIVCVSEVSKRWRLKNPEKLRALKLSYAKRNPDICRAAGKRWRDAHPEYMRASKRNAKAKRKMAFGQHTSGDVADIFKMQKGKCAYCRIKMGDKYTVDHIVPLSKGGSNNRRNLQLACLPCNVEKHARDPLHHARVLGMLL